MDEQGNTLSIEHHDRAQIDTLARSLCWALYNADMESVTPMNHEFCLKVAIGQARALRSVFKDQARFMIACGQTVDQWNIDQFNMYIDLHMEETKELAEAVKAKDKVEIMDALLDCMVVDIGAGLSLGLPMELGWQEVIRSNMTKVDPVTGKVRRREDGKILKGDNYSPPNLARLMK